MPILINFKGEHVEADAHGLAIGTAGKRRDSLRPHLQPDILRNIPIFQSLTVEELQRIWEIVIQRNMPKKTVIFHEGTEKESVYFIHEGLVKTFKTDDNGHEQIVSILGSGDMFPHTGLFNRDTYPATAETLVDSVLLAIPVQSFERLLWDKPGISIKVMQVLSDKVKELQEALQQITGQDVRDRAISFLLKLAENNGVFRQGRVHIEVPITNQEFANAIGTTRETINRIITQLRKAGLLETNRNGFVIADYEAFKGMISQTRP